MHALVIAFVTAALKAHGTIGLELFKASYLRQEDGFNLLLLFYIKLLGVSITKPIK